MNLKKFLLNDVVNPFTKTTVSVLQNVQSLIEDKSETKTTKQDVKPSAHNLKSLEKSLQSFLNEFNSSDVEKDVDNSSLENVKDIFVNYKSGDFQKEKAVLIDNFKKLVGHSPNHNDPFFHYYMKKAKDGGIMDEEFLLLSKLQFKIFDLERELYVTKQKLEKLQSKNVFSELDSRKDNMLKFIDSISESETNDSLCIDLSKLKAADYDSILNDKLKQKARDEKYAKIMKELKEKGRVGVITKSNKYDNLDDNLDDDFDDDNFDDSDLDDSDLDDK